MAWVTFCVWRVSCVEGMFSNSFSINQLEARSKATVMTTHSRDSLTSMGWVGPNVPQGGLEEDCPRL